jgi:hypothetical protein
MEACRIGRLQSLAHEPPVLTRMDRRGSAPPLACFFVKRPRWLGTLQSQVQGLAVLLG